MSLFNTGEVSSSFAGPSGKALAMLNKSELQFLAFFADWAPSFAPSVSVDAWREIYNKIQSDAVGWHEPIMEVCFRMLDLQDDGFDSSEELILESIEHTSIGMEEIHTELWLEDFELQCTPTLVEFIASKLTIL